MDQDSKDDRPKATESDETPEILTSSKTIQPRDAFIDEMKSSKEAKNAEGKDQNNQKKNFDVSNVYPEVKEERVDQPDKQDKDPVDSSAALSYGNGSKAGGKIYIYQLLFTIGLIIIGYLVRSSATSVPSSFKVISLILSIVTIFLVFLVPYIIISKLKVQWAVWLTAFGVSFASLVLGIIYYLSFSSLFTFVLRQTNVSSVEIILVNLVVIVASYFIERLIWGLSFKLFGKLNNSLKIRVLAISSLLVFVLIVVVIRHFTLQPLVMG